MIMDEKPSPSPLQRELPLGQRKPALRLLRTDSHVKHLIRVLDDHASPGCVCWLALETIAAEMCVSVRTAQRAIAQGKAEGLLIIGKRKKHTRSNLYTLRWADIVEKACNHGRLEACNHGADVTPQDGSEDGFDEGGEGGVEGGLGESSDANLASEPKNSDAKLASEFSSDAKYDDQLASEKGEEGGRGEEEDFFGGLNTKPPPPSSSLANQSSNLASSVSRPLVLFRKASPGSRQEPAARCGAADSGDAWGAVIKALEAFPLIAWQPALHAAQDRGCSPEHVLALIRFAEVNRWRWDSPAGALHARLRRAVPAWPVEDNWPKTSPEAKAKHEAAARAAKAGEAARQSRAESQTSEELARASQKRRQAAEAAHGAALDAMPVEERDSLAREVLGVRGMMWELYWRGREHPPWGEIRGALIRAMARRAVAVGGAT